MCYAKEDHCRMKYIKGPDVEVSPVGEATATANIHKVTTKQNISEGSVH